MTDNDTREHHEDFDEQATPIACTQVHEHDPIDCAPESLESLKRQAREA